MQLCKIKPFSPHFIYALDLVKAAYPNAIVTGVACIVSDKRIIPDGSVTLYYPVPINMIGDIVKSTFWPSNGNQYGRGIYMTTRLRAFNDVDKVAVIVCRALVNNDNAVQGIPDVVLQPGMVAVDRFVDPQYVVFQDVQLIYPEYVILFRP